MIKNCGTSREGLDTNQPTSLKSHAMKIITLIASSLILILSGCKILETLGIGSAKKEAPAAEEKAPAPAAEEKAPAPAPEK